jgi:hypothetical protein
VGKRGRFGGGFWGGVFDLNPVDFSAVFDGEDQKDFDRAGTIYFEDDSVVAYSETISVHDCVLEFYRKIERIFLRGKKF